MSLSSKAQTGQWVDESSDHGLQTLQSKANAAWFRALVAVCLTLSAPFITRMVLSTLQWLNYVSAPRATRFAAASNSGDDSESLRTRQVIQTSKSGRGIFKQGYKIWRQKKIGLNSNASLLLFFSIVLFSAVVAQGLVGAILADNIHTDQVGLLDSSECGLYEYNDEKGGDEEAARATIKGTEKERRAAAYAQNCYVTDAEQKGQAMTCDHFYNSTINVVQKPETCPFRNSSVCARGYQERAAVTFDTGVVDASVLGINNNPSHKFRRITTCAPLSIERPYVRHYTSSPEDHGYLYYYGSLYDTTQCSASNTSSDPITEYTMSIAGHPFDWLAPVYRVNTYATSLLGPECDFYQPIPDLAPEDENSASSRTKTLTIIFVTALHILYNEPSNDPIFPANKPFTYPGDSKALYYNSIPKARPLACLDETLLCAPSGSPCWHETDAIPAGIANTTAYWLMKYALKNSNTYDSIKYRLGSALLAQQRVGQSRSLKIDDDHWEKEAEHLFKTSLARAQFDTWSIASGEDRDNPTFTDTLPDEAKGQVCGLFKFRSTGYVNTKVASLVMWCLVLPASILLSLKTRMISKVIRKQIFKLRHKLRIAQTSPRARGTNPDEDTGDSPPASMAANTGDANDQVFSIGSSSSSRRTSDAPQQSGDATSSIPTPQHTEPMSSTPLSVDATPATTTGTTSYGSISNNSESDRQSCRRQAESGNESSSRTRGEQEENQNSEWSPLVIHSLIYGIWMIISSPWYLYAWYKRRHYDRIRNEGSAR